MDTPFSRIYVLLCGMGHNPADGYARLEFTPKGETKLNLRITKQKCPHQMRLYACAKNEALVFAGMITNEWDGTLPICRENLLAILLTDKTELCGAGFYPRLTDEEKWRLLVNARCALPNGAKEKQPTIKQGSPPEEDEKHTVLPDNQASGGHTTKAKPDNISPPLLPPGQNVPVPPQLSLSQQLQPLIYPPALRTYQAMLARGEPCAPFTAPGWRFARLSFSKDALYSFCVAGILQKRGRVCAAAFLLPGAYSPAPPPSLPGYRYLMGQNGQGYWACFSIA